MKTHDFRQLTEPLKNTSETSISTSFGHVVQNKSLSAETVEGSALSLEHVDHVHGSDGLPLGVLRLRLLDVVEDVAVAVAASKNKVF